MYDIIEFMKTVKEDEKSEYFLKDIGNGSIMFEDTEVLYFNIKENYIILKEGNLVPLHIRLSYDNPIPAIKEWMAERVINKFLKNYKQLTTYFNTMRVNSIEYKAKLAYNTRAVSMEDAYWIKYESEDMCWRKVCLYNRDFKDLAGLFLSEFTPDRTGSFKHPNITLSGTFPKTWIKQNGNIKLMKIGKTSDDINAKVEYLASDFIGRVLEGSFDYVKYNKGTVTIDGESRICTMCRPYYKEGLSVVKASELMEYLGYDDFMEYIHTTPDILTQFANMIIIDYMIGNTDRQLDDFGFYMDRCGNIVEMLPIYDFNYAFICDYMSKDISETIHPIFKESRTVEEVIEDYSQYADVDLSLQQLKNFYVINNVDSLISTGIATRISNINRIRSECNDTYKQFCKNESKHRGIGA